MELAERPLNGRRGDGPIARGRCGVEIQAAWNAMSYTCRTWSLFIAL